MYISIIYVDIMQFPQHVVELKFDNDYDIILLAFSVLLDRFEQEDQSFAAQCIWWLAGIIQYAVILKYYRLYGIFPFDYVENCLVSPIVRAEKSIISDSRISELMFDSDIGYHSTSVEREFAEAQSIL